MARMMEALNSKGKENEMKQKEVEDQGSEACDREASTGSTGGKG